MAEHVGLIQVTTFRPAPGRRDEVLALCTETQQRAAAADGCFGAQTCAVDEDPDAVVANLPVARPAQPGGIPGRRGR
jgi:quinol monooxygenase YgiN